MDKKEKDKQPSLVLCVPFDFEANLSAHIPGPVASPGGRPNLKEPKGRPRPFMVSSNREFQRNLTRKVSL